MTDVRRPLSGARTWLSTRMDRARATIGARWPKPDFWNGVARAVRGTAWVVLLTEVVLLAGQAPALASWAGLALAAMLAVLVAFVAMLAIQLVIRIPAALRGAILLFAVAMLVALPASPVALAAIAVILFAGVGLLGGGVAVMRRRGACVQSAIPMAAGALIVVVWVAGALVAEWPGEERIVWRPMASQQIELADPGERGDRAYRLVHYGSGEDPRRPEFGKGVDFVTKPVDGSKLLDGWTGRAGWARTRYWDVEPDRLPVQGRAWIPDGDGPFPIVLIVHGNHSMEDFSDTGYAWLAERLASRGNIAVSVDENFLNSSFADLLGVPDTGLEKENDARGWLLLKHLEQWRAWNADPDHPLAGKADLDRVVLVGHSRGGEAVSEAALFNRLPAFPDDATMAFEFGFGIAGVVAIAPVDRQYDPRDLPTRPVDVSYLVLHGAHDGDVTSYAGFATFSQVAFPACAVCFKAGVWLIGANHGQFNTSWGRLDGPLPMANWLNLAHLMDGEVQRQVGATLIGAFIEATVHGRTEYRTLLASPDRASALWPDGVRYLSQFRAATDVVVADFDEDADVGSAAGRPGAISAERLALWREQEVALKWHDASTVAVVLAWNANANANADEVASWRVQLPQRGVDAGATLNLSLAASPEAPGEIDDWEAPEETDFSLVLADRKGHRASLPLHTRRPLGARTEPRVFKLHALHNDPSEVVFQRYRFEIGEWLALEPALDPAALESLTLVFDRTPAATILIDDVTLSPAGD